MKKQSFTIIFGLTADPIHLGHEQAIINGIQFMKGQGLPIHKFLLIPVYQPHLIANKKAPIANYQHRFTMCEMAAQRLSERLNCSIEVSDIEKQLVKKTGQMNFSINTIKAIEGENILFMVSADHFQGRWPKFRKWHQWQALLKYSGLLINQRPGHGINNRFIEQIKAINPNIFVVNSDQNVDTSSTEIRSNIQKAYENHCLSHDIANYIKSNDLYIF